MIDYNSSAYKSGQVDGRAGNRYTGYKYHRYQERLDYRAGYEAGEATASGDTDVLTEEERREIYGEERDQA